MSLGALADFRICLGHGGEECPTQRNPAHKMTIVHEHGVAPMRVLFCACPVPGKLEAKPDTEQLLEFGLFPGTWTQPVSAYTIHGLRAFRLLSLQCQTTTHDYFRYLRRSTDNIQPEDTGES